jgi:hypothetical protein
LLWFVFQIGSHTSAQVSFRQRPFYLSFLSGRDYRQMPPHSALILVLIFISLLANYIECLYVDLFAICASLVMYGFKSFA